jgi:hypothetical protein
MYTGGNECVYVNTFAGRPKGKKLYLINRRDVCKTDPEEIQYCDVFAPCGNC